jgi:hypothetical protein
VLHTYRYLRCQLSALNPFPDADDLLQLVADITLAGYKAAPGQASALRRTAEVLCTVRGVSVRREGLLPSMPVIYFCTPKSTLQGIAACSVIPCAPIADLEASRSRWIGSLGGRMNAMFVDVGDAQRGARALRHALLALRQKVSVAMFARSAEDRQLRAVLGLSRLSGVPVVPLALRTQTPPVGFLKRGGLFERPVDLTVAIGPAIHVADGTGLTAFQSRIESWISQWERARAVTGFPHAWSLSNPADLSDSRFRPAARSRSAVRQAAFHA